jgi:predicted PurR-regulated permease PerM
MEQDQPRSGSFLRLSSRQQTAVGAALTIIAAAVILVTVLGAGWITAAFVRRFSHVFLPLAVGGVAALVFRPFYQLLRTRARFPAPLALVSVFASILIPLVAFGWFFGAIAVDQISDMAQQVPHWYEQTVTELKERWPAIREFMDNNPWGQRLKEVAEGQKEAILDGLTLFGGQALSAGKGIARGIGTLVSWAVLPVYFSFFLMAESRKPVALGQLLPFLKSETRKDVVYLIHEFVNIIVAFFRGQLIIAFLQGLLFAIGFSAVGLKYGFVLGMMLGLLNIIPYLGSIIGLSIGLPLAYFQDGGGPFLVLWVMVVFTVVQLIEAYLLTPKIMGDRTGLHPIVIIVAIFFWGSALQGILGMILAIPLTAFLVVFWRLLREKYIGELV